MLGEVGRQNEKKNKDTKSRLNVGVPVGENHGKT